jgi:hypothetical protein
MRVVVMLNLDYSDMRQRLAELIRGIKKNDYKELLHDFGSFVFLEQPDTLVVATRLHLNGTLTTSGAFPIMRMCPRVSCDVHIEYQEQETGVVVPVHKITGEKYCFNQSSLHSLFQSPETEPVPDSEILDLFETKLSKDDTSLIMDEVVFTCNVVTTDLNKLREYNEVDDFSKLPCVLVSTVYVLTNKSNRPS